MNDNLKITDVSTVKDQMVSIDIKDLPILPLDVKPMPWKPARHGGGAVHNAGALLQHEVDVHARGDLDAGVVAPGAVGVS